MSARRRRTTVLGVVAVAVLAASPIAPARSVGGGPSTAAGAGEPSGVFPTLRPSLVAFYDFEHPVRGDPGWERDRGRSGTDIELVNGGPAMRVRDRAYPSSRRSLQVRQVDPVGAGNDDWKAGVYAASGVPSLRAFNAVEGATVAGWFKLTGANPSPNTGTPDPDDRDGAVGLAGVLSGGSDGHQVRALLELITVDDTLRLVALGRRVDGGSSQTFAADADWQTLLPLGEWVHLAATFDFDTGAMRLYRNGRSLSGFYTLPGDPWAVDGPPEPDAASPTDPAGIKIGGSFPQNDREANPCDCRMDGLMFLDRALRPWEVYAQYHWVRRG
jgi:Concanavalin A-like lectin/glucanases superfamily